MRFGLAFANIARFSTPEGAVAIARAAENAGFDSIWTVEHVVVPQGYESEYPYAENGRMPGRESAAIPDPLIWLTYLAAQTTTLRLATGVVILPQRNPVVFAKECATLAQLCGGRFTLGVGAGWLEEEFLALGVPFADRGARLDDHIGALRALWTQSPASHAGTHHQFENVYCEPRPSEPIPIVIGGHTKVAARRAGRLGDGFFPAKGSLDDLRELFTVMRAEAVAAGRDPDAIEITASGEAAFAPDPVSALREYEDAGVTRVAIPPLTFDLATIDGVLGRFGDEVIAKF